MFARLRPGVSRNTRLLSRASRPLYNGSFRAGSAQNVAVSVSGLVALALGVYSITRVSNERVSLDAPRASFARTISYEEVIQHNGRDSPWVIIHGKVYDLTKFVKKHPGGAAIIYNNAGKDVSAIYDSFHSAAFLTTILTSEQCLGDVDPKTVPKSAAPQKTEDQLRVENARANKPPLSSIINLDDFERVAQTVLPVTSWAYYSGAAEDEASHIGNLQSFSRYWFRPRILRETAVVEYSTTMVGIPTTMPIFVSPAALAGLGDPLGEINITRGAGRTGIIQGISNNASCTIDEIADARRDGQPLIFQLYINKDRGKSERIVREIEALGFRAIMLTVDTSIMGKRESDMRAKGAVMTEVPTSAQKKGEADESGPGIGQSLGDFYDMNLGWKDVHWLKSITSLPIILKGIQCVEDVELAVENGVSGVLLSNHGGRQLSYAPAAIDVLYELHQERPDLLKTIDVFVDGGVRRGTDVLKALCLGAKGVGLGRPFLFANAAYGEEGVVKAIRIMEDEIGRGMRLLGVTRLEDLKPEMVKVLSGK